MWCWGCELGSHLKQHCHHRKLPSNHPAEVWKPGQLELKRSQLWNHGRQKEQITCICDSKATDGRKDKCFWDCAVRHEQAVERRLLQISLPRSSWHKQGNAKDKRGKGFSMTPVLHSAVITTIWIKGKHLWNRWTKLWNLAQMMTWSTRLTSPKHFLDIPRCCLWCWYGQILGYQGPVRRWQNRALHTVRRKTRKTGNTANQGHSQIKQAERIPYPDNAKHDGKAHGADSG